MLETLQLKVRFFFLFCFFNQCQVHLCACVTVAVVNNDPTVVSQRTSHKLCRRPVTVAPKLGRDPTAAGSTLSPWQQVWDVTTTPQLRPTPGYDGKKAMCFFFNVLKSNDGASSGVRNIQI